jgi:hypothetical protein
MCRLYETGVVYWRPDAQTSRGAGVQVTEQRGRIQDRIAAALPERLFTSISMALVALVSNVVRPSTEEIRSNIERSRDPYFRAFLSHCMSRVYGRR